MTQASADRAYLSRCHDLAADALRSGNTAVGSLVVKRQAVLAEGREETPAGPDPFAHAEIIAVRKAMQVVGREHLRAATLYTTAEPCFLCSFAIREARLGRVVMARRTSEIGGVTSRYPILTAGDIARWGSPPEVVWIPGVEAGEERT